MLELLRLLILVGVLGLLWKPELQTTHPPKDKAQITVLWDDSKSTESQDSESIHSGSSITRADSIQELIKSEIWQTIAESSDVDLVFSKFASPTESTRSGTDISTPIYDQLDGNDNIKALVLLSDGDWNSGDAPTQAAQRLRDSNIPLFTVPIGSTTPLPDIELSEIVAPSFGILGEPVQIYFTVKSTIDNDQLHEITFTSPQSSQQVRKQIRVPANSEVSDSIIWKVDQAGEFTLNATIPIYSGEVNTENNTKNVLIRGKDEHLKILVIDSQPRWEYRFIRNALSRDQRVDLDCLLFHPSETIGSGVHYLAKFPSDKKQLQQYDVIFIGDIGVKEGQLTEQEADQIHGLIKHQASGVVFIPGQSGHQASLLKHPLGEAIPVILDQEFPMGKANSLPANLSLTKAGQSSLLTMLGDSEDANAKIWHNLPGFYWHAPILRAKAGAQILATHAHSRNKFGRIPLLVSSQFGSGKVLYLGHDSAWRWRRGVEDLYHYRFWGQVARWMSYQRKMAAGERLRIHFAPERPEIGQTIYFHANASDAEGSPLTNGDVSLILKSPGGKSQFISLNESTSSWGGYTGSTKVDSSGTWSINGQIVDDISTLLEATFIVPDTPLEKASNPARHDVLYEMTKITNGQSLSPTELGQFPTLLHALPQRKAKVTMTLLWGSTYYMIALLSALTAFWILRKALGYF